MRYSTFVALVLCGCLAGAANAATSVDKSPKTQPLTAPTLFCTLSRPLLEHYLQLRYRQRLLELSEAYLRTLSHLIAWQYVAVDAEAEDLELRRKLRQLKAEAARAVRQDRSALEEAQRSLELLLDEPDATSGTIKVLDGLDWLQLLEEWAPGEGIPARCPGSIPEVIAAERSESGPNRDRKEIEALVDHIAGLASRRDRLQRRFSARDPVLWKLLNVEVNIYINARPLADARHRLLLARLGRWRGADSPSPVIAAPLLASASSHEKRDGLSAPLIRRAEPAEPIQDPGKDLPEALAPLKEAGADEPAVSGWAPHVAEGRALEMPGRPAAMSQAQINAREVVYLVYDWAKAWASRDIDRYLAFYSPDFRPSSGKDRATWEKARRRIIGHARGIRIELDRVDVQVAGNGTTASFVQHYQSANYRDTTTKELRFQRKDGRWLIVAESNR